VRGRWPSRECCRSVCSPVRLHADLTILGRLALELEVLESDDNILVVERASLI
jgi:hypothetical protein